MKRSKLKIAALLAAAVLIVDAALIVYADDKMSAPVAWTQIVGAVALQVVVIGILVAWMKIRRDRSTVQTDSQVSSRSQVPLTMIGLALVALGFSLCLLYTGVVCPSHGIPITRGMSLCS